MALAGRASIHGLVASIVSSRGTSLTTQTLTLSVERESRACVTQKATGRGAWIVMTPLDLVV